MEQFVERRKFLRLEEGLPVRYSKSLKKHEDLSFIDTLQQDIGGGGIKIFVNEDIKEGTILTLRIDLPSQSGPIPIFATGEVVWKEKIEKERFGLGIRFIKIEEEDQKKIIEYVETSQK